MRLLLEVLLRLMVVDVGRVRVVKVSAVKAVHVDVSTCSTVCCHCWLAVRS